MKHCPKCNGTMEEARVLQSERALEFINVGEVKLSRKNQLRSDAIIPYYCTECGYIELYKEKKQEPESNRARLKNLFRTD